MASLISRGPKKWRIQILIDGRRESLTFKASKKEAQDLFLRIDRLEGYAKRGLRPSAEILDWIRDLDQEFRLRLAEIGLLELGRVGGSLDDLLKYSRELLQIEPRTRVNYDQYDRSLREFFGASRPIASISQGDADEFRRWLARPGRVDAKRGYGPASIAKRIKYARQIFEIAVRKEWLDRNAFHGIKVAVKIDEKKRFFVAAHIAQKVIDELVSIEDKLAFALGRFAGFRIGSELRALRWSSVDQEKLLIEVADVKRKTSRRCPMFIELQSLFDEAWAAIPDGGGDWVFPTIRAASDQAFKSRVLKAIKRAGLDAWPNLFLNLRRTRATEIVEEYGAKAESEWIGHGIDISLRHYQIVSQDKLDRAVGRITKEEAKIDETAHN